MTDKREETIFNHLLQVSNNFSFENCYGSIYYFLSILLLTLCLLKIKEENKSLKILVLSVIVG